MAKGSADAKSDASGFCGKHLNCSESFFSAQLHKAEPHLQTLDLVVFSIGDVIQATGCPESHFGYPVFLEHTTNMLTLQHPPAALV